MAENTPIISVVIPAYNVEKYLEKCLQSVLAQTFQDFEVLLVDDGATDSTPVLCDALARTDARIHVYHKQNGGLSDARNYGLDRMSGKYVTFIDSDDYVSPDYLQVLYDLISQNANVQVAMIPGQSLPENAEPEETQNVSSTVLTAEEAVRKILLRQGIGHTSWGKLYLASLWGEIRFPVGQNYEDYATTYHVLAGAEQVAFCNAKLYYYIQHAASIMHQTCSEKTLSVLDVSDAVTAFIISKWKTSEIEALELQAATYLKNMQAILNTGSKSFPAYQKRIVKKIRENAGKLLLAGQVPLKDKAKIFALLLSKKLFIKLYNAHNGDVAV